MARRSMSLGKKLVTVTGLKQVQENLKKLSQAAEGEAILKVVMAATKSITDRMKQAAPVDTGNLKLSIFATYGQPNKKAKRPTVLAGVNYSPKRSGVGHFAPYAHLVEFGTDTMRPQPFVHPSIKAGKGEFVSICKDGFQKIIDDITKKNASLGKVLK